MDRDTLQSWELQARDGYRVEGVSLDLEDPPRGGPYTAIKLACWLLETGILRNQTSDLVIALVTLKDALAEAIGEPTSGVVERRAPHILGGGDAAQW